MTFSTLLWPTVAASWICRWWWWSPTIPDLADQVCPFRVPFIFVPARKEIRDEAERRQLTLLRGNVDLVVLARYVQIPTPRFATRWAARWSTSTIVRTGVPSGPPPFGGPKERGLKLVGATVHYVTANLDEGPIIEQDVVRVDHRHSVDDLTRLGADVERAVLSHCEDRII
jgi:formyltetrahydrofolate deformylase